MGIVGQFEVQPKPTESVSPTLTDHSDVLAVIVTYNPGSDLEQSLQNLESQGAHILVVDNSERESVGELLRSLQGRHRFELIRNGTNLGIAGALNRGVLYAQKNGYRWLLTLDQDSILPADYLQILKQTYQQSPERDRIAILAPAHFDKTTGYQSRDYRGLSGPYISKDIVMTSGNLIPMTVFDKLGLFDEDLFIEYVDHDFCLRVKKAGFKTVIVGSALLGHSLGVIRKHSLTRQFFFFSHNYHPVRRYYRARNRVILYRRYFGWWILQDQEFAIKDMIKILLVEKNKWEKVKATIAGTFDAFLGRMGSFDGAVYGTPKAPKYFIEFREEILPLLPEKAERALDLGCGSGETSGHLRKIGRFGWVCGVEGSSEAAVLARKKLDQVLEGDIEKIEYPFAPNSLDVILALDILEHLVDPWTTVKKLKHFLKPGGVIVTSIPNVRHYNVVVPLIFRGDWQYTQEGLLDSTHIRFFTRKTAQRLFEREGLILDAWDHTGAKKGWGAVLNRLTFGLFKDFIIFQNLYRFRKPTGQEKSQERLT